MAFKVQYMWGQVVVSIGKPFMAMALIPCPAYPRLHHRPVHGAAAALVAAPLRSHLKICQRLTEIQNVRSLMLPYSTSGRLIVSLITQ